MNRRLFLRGAATLLCAPAIVRASSLMPVKAWAEPLTFRGVPIVFDQYPMSPQMLELTAVTRRAFRPVFTTQIWADEPLMLELQRNAS